MNRTLSVSGTSQKSLMHTCYISDINIHNKTMETLQNIISGRQKIPFDGFLDFTPLGSSQKKYLSQVYALLVGSVLCTAIGLQVACNVFAVPLLLSAIGQLGCVLYISATAAAARMEHGIFKDQDALKRLGAFAALSFLSGSSLSSLVSFANYLNPSILPTAFFATSAAFICLSLAAMFAKERSYLYLGSILSSVLLYLSMISLFNMFFHSRIAHDIVLFGGLMAYLGFVLYDTQAILYEHSRGIKDPILHALTFYVDIIGLFVRLMRILIDREQRNRQDENRKRR